MPLDEKIIVQAGERYWREQDRYRKLAEFVAAKCQDIIDNNAIRASVQWRIKDRDRFEKKLRAKYLPIEAERNKLNSVEDIFQRIGDLAGVRVSTYAEGDREKVVQKIEKAFAGPGDGGTVTIERMDSSESFYRATHCQVALLTESLVHPYDNLEGLTCEIQICSLLAHVWNEIEHDLGYKPTTGQLSETENDLLEGLAHQMESGDKVIKQLLFANERRLSIRKGAFQDVYDFVVRMRDLFPSAKAFAENAAQVYEELISLGLDSPDKIVADLLHGEYQTRAMVLLLKITQYAIAKSDTTVVPDSNSSDQLLVLLLEKHLNQILANHPAGQGRGRPPRIASFAKRFKEMPK